MTASKSVDVLIIGAGPVGLLTAYQLAQWGCSVHIIDKEDKSSMKESGRANVLYSRSAELLDQLSLVDDLLQQCDLVRESYTYDSDGKRVIPARVWNFVENIEDTRFDFAIMLRQAFIEGCLRGRLAEVGVALAEETECVGFEALSESEGGGVVSVLRSLGTGEEYTVQSKYLMGADGGRSFVRRRLNIPFEGDTTQDKWIRVDGRIKTDLPTPRAYASIESQTHGNVLWAPLDRGLTRIGYVYTPEQEARHGRNLTKEAVIEEAIAAVKPFKLEFESVEWWTLYIIGQRVASTYQPHERILLVGDACHTHSSGAAQGLNTGIHDATNLAWKLSLVLRGLAKPSLLETYNSERRSAAQRLITFDKRISTLMANKWPAGEEPQPGEEQGKDINAVLADAFDDAKGYNTGLGIGYVGNLINQSGSGGEGLCALRAGERAPDVALLRPGTLEKVRLHSVTPNRGCMYLVAFVGDPRDSLAGIASFSSYLAQSGFLTAAAKNDVIRIITIPSVGDTSLGTQEALEGQAPFSPVYYDRKRGAHKRYGVGLKSGAVVVLRPDGYVGFVAELSGKGGQAVEEYLGGFLVV
ncbi:FAD binding domain-containing protein [Aspergillus pseudoustus]|uniref:FAD binding domain-containing protein n=1 Tax=Aspergillus pseudoustus TaxID=1810923 RepID=A0ABR4JA73_9EURO